MPETLMSTRTLALISAIAISGATPALALHPMAGAMPETLWQGLLPGLGHPMIGLDDLAFVIGIGVFSAIAGLGGVMPAVFRVFMGAVFAGASTWHGYAFAEAVVGAETDVIMA